MYIYKKISIPHERQSYVNHEGTFKKPILLKQTVVNNLQHSNRCKIVIQTINKPNFPRTCLLRLINYFHNQGIAVLVANDYYELKKKYISYRKKR